MRAAANPFTISILAQGADFADREGEVARIETALRTPGGKLVVYGDRRLGKSSALERAADLVRSAGGRAAVASFATASDASEAAQRVLTAAQRSVGPSWRELLEAVGRSLRAGFEVSPSMDPGGAPGIRFRFAVEPQDNGTLLPDALTALDEQLTRRGLTLGLGIDEFQRLHEWGGEAAEWALREAIQRHGSIGYVLAGSRRHLIEAMIGVKGRALWKLADVRRFGPIDAGLMADWIVEQAAAQGVAVPPAEAAGIIRLAGPRTRDIVQLARAVWAVAATSGGVEAGSAEAAFDAIVAEQGELYRTIFMKLTARQQGVLRAYAAEVDVQITSAAAQHRYRLGAKSTVQSTVSALVEAEHLARDDGGGYTFDDPYFRRWVQLHALADIGESAPRLPG